LPHQLCDSLFVVPSPKASRSGVRFHLSTASPDHLSNKPLPCFRLFFAPLSPLLPVQFFYFSPPYRLTGFPLIQSPPLVLAYRNLYTQNFPFILSNFLLSRRLLSPSHLLLSLVRRVAHSLLTPLVSSFLSHPSLPIPIPHPTPPFPSSHLHVPLLNLNIPAPSSLPLSPPLFDPPRRPPNSVGDAYRPRLRFEVICHITQYLQTGRAWMCALSSRPPSAGKRNLCELAPASLSPSISSVFAFLFHSKDV